MAAIVQTFTATAVVEANLAEADAEAIQLTIEQAET